MCFLSGYIFSNSDLKKAYASWSKMQNSTSLSALFGPFFKKATVSLTSIFAHRSLGKPNIPALIAGTEMLDRPFSIASFRTLFMARLNLSSSSPSPILGPTVWMTCRALSLPPVVITAVPTAANPILSLSSWMMRPPLRTIAPATPPPCWSRSLAAFTIASTSRSVRSADIKRTVTPLTGFSNMCIPGSAGVSEQREQKSAGPSRPLSLVGIKGLVPDHVLAALLHRVHEIIGNFYHLINGCGRTNEGNSADTECYGPSMLPGDFQKFFLDLADGRLRGFVSGLRQQDHEFVAAHPRYEIDFSNILLYGFCDGAQQHIAHVVSEKIVHQLKIIQIHINHGKGTLIPVRPVVFDVGVFEKGPPIQCPCQKIGTGRCFFAIKCGSYRRYDVRDNQKYARFLDHVPKRNEKMRLRDPRHHMSEKPGDRAYQGRQYPRPSPPVPGDQRNRKEIKYQERKIPACQVIENTQENNEHGPGYDMKISGLPVQKTYNICLYRHHRVRTPFV